MKIIYIFWSGVKIRLDVPGFHQRSGQLSLGSSRQVSSRPGSSRPGPILSLVGMCLIKKEFIQQKLRKDF